MTHFFIPEKILHTFDEKDNQIYGLDYNLTANRFSTSGMDMKVILIKYEYVINL